MHRYKALAIFFTLLTIGATRESLRIFLSTKADIADNRTELTVLAFVLTLFFLLLTLRFWRKTKNNPF